MTNAFLRNIKGQNYDWFFALVSKQNVVVLRTSSFPEFVARKEKEKNYVFFPLTH